jgi:hypothetical protein
MVHAMVVVELLKNVPLGENRKMPISQICTRKNKISETDAGIRDSAVQEVKFARPRHRTQGGLGHGYDDDHDEFRS